MMFSFLWFNQMTSGSAWGAIREAMLQIVMHAGRKSAIDGYTRRQPYSPKAHWISYPLPFELGARQGTWRLRATYPGFRNPAR
jgi:hypothetical protein